jgi:hypothetical protein
MSLLRYLAGKTDPTFRRDRVSNCTVSIYLYNINVPVLYLYTHIGCI